MSDFKGCITHGPWGGSHGHKWVYMPPNFIRKMKITVKHGDVVDSIKFQTTGSNGEAQSSFFGGKGGTRTSSISIDCTIEYLMSISGTIGRCEGYDVVSSIYFMTNQNLYGPYGFDNGNIFSYDIKGGVVVGFHGRVSKCLNAIGVYVMPESLALAQISTYEDKIMPELCSSMSRMAMSREAGPWGVDGGKSWDDGVYSNIKQVRVYLGLLNVIYAIQFEYLKKDGKSVSSQIHGGTSASKIELVELDGEEEFLTGISGFFGPVEGHNGMEAIASISFHTNKRIHGPFGEEKGVGYYSSTPSSGKILGFHGRNNGFLSAIGVHMEYF
ncbi:hypothetical protein QVD17_16011 [Tagetes erecta]|uniref:Jacalin-type lectin domain-containing protein n=1 Tax=Tagetes erecta TaxID=13708 RepID=A0AAD8KTG2_TARER|nr:hypothetical protein QVD17_16011 [Tagetes erecta]